MQPDNELLRQYAQTGSEVAFAELVKRHVNLVYSAALRQVGGDAHLAHDVAQSVFTDLARKAASLCRRESLTGWLYTSAHFAACKLVRAEHRRRAREEQFMSDPANLPTTELDWETLRPILDSAMHGLHETDREAVLLRYFENRPYAEVGAKLGLNENAARMRVERALEKLRSQLSRRAITTTVTLASVISANAVQVAPPALAVTLTKTSIAAGAGTSFALFKLMALTPLKIALSTVVVATVATTMVLQHRTQQQLRDDNESLRQQLAQIKSDNQESPPPNAQPTNDDFNELLRLRGEVNALRSQTNQIAKLQNENQKLQSSLAITGARPKADNNQTPDQEFAMIEVGSAKQSVLGIILYANEHGNQFPTNLTQVASYLDNSKSSYTNQDHFEITYTGSLADLANPSQAIVVREIQPWQHNGGWVKAYGFADGHAQLYSSPNANFDDYEQKHAPILKNQPAQ